jgi:hypothetical protein
MLFPGRPLLLILLACLALSSSTVAFAGGEAAGSWKKVTANDLAEITVEQSLYQKPDSPLFYVRVRIHNKTDKEIGFDATKSSSVFYVNQFVENDEPTRMTVDEMRMVPQAISDQQKDRLNATFADKSAPDTFVHLAPGKDFEYFVAFMGPDDPLGQLQKSKAKYAVLVVDGHMNITDGNNVQRLERGPMDIVGGEVPVSLPPKWEQIPAGSKIIDKSS